jgi:hypothetical protein
MTIIRTYHHPFELNSKFHRVADIGQKDSAKEKEF